MEQTLVESGAIPTIPFLVLCPVERAVPAAAESVIERSNEYVRTCVATGNCIIRIGEPFPRTSRLYVSVAFTCPIPIPSPIK